MSRIILICIIASPFLKVFSQDFNTVYFNSKWEMTSQKFSSYYRISGFDDKLMAYDGDVVDYYSDGTIEMKGTYKNGQKEGDFIYYYPDGKIRLKTSYTGNRRSGIWTQYNRDGSVLKEAEYKNASERLIWQSDSKGNNFIRAKQQNFKMTFWYDVSSEICFEEDQGGNCYKYTIAGKMTNGVKDGLWTIKYESRDVYNLYFRNGEFMKGYRITYPGNRIEIHSDKITYLFFEPEKITVTEAFSKEQGQMIKLNYVLKALLEEEKRNQAKTELNDESDLLNYFNRNYSHFVKNCSDTATISVNLTIDGWGMVKLLSVSPGATQLAKREVIRIIGSISKLKKWNSPEFSFRYRIQCLGELEYKR